jgi:hypothetical protein
MSRHRAAAAGARLGVGVGGVGQEAALSARAE